MLGSGTNRIEETQIRSQLDILLQAPGLVSSPRRKDLLRYLIERTLEGKSDQLTEYGIGLDVFGRDPSFDPRLDSIVRTETSRLRQKLKTYYESQGISDPLLIEIPQRSYAPVFSMRNGHAPASLAPAKRREFSLSRSGAVSVLALASLLCIFIFYFIRARKPAAETGPPARSVVVLPFQNYSPDPGAEYLADGVTEEITNELAQRPDLRVVARTSAFQFKGQALDIRDIGRKLNVMAALEGSISRAGGSMRITAQLNRTSDGFHLWSRSYEVPSERLAEVETEISGGTALALRGSAGALAPHLSTTNPQAHDLYLRASFQFARHTPDSQKASLDLFRRAAALDPSYIPAYVGIARAEIAMIHLTSESPAEGIGPIRKALENALRIDPSAAGEVRGLMGYIDYNFEWNWPLADEEYRLALALGAQSTTQSSYGWSLATRGRFREAHEHLRIAGDLDPLSEGPRINEFFADYLERRFGDAQAILRKLLEMSPDLLDAHLLLALVGTVQHDCRTASAEAEWGSRKYPTMPLTRFGLAMAAACQGDAGRTRLLLTEMAASPGTSFVSPYQMALGYAFLHDKERALAELEKSATAREGQILYLKYEPVFDEIRADSRYQALERRVGLE